MHRKLAPLLPANVGPALSDHPDTSSTKRRRATIAIACNACRRRKIRCDGVKPTCTGCQGSIKPCLYRDVNLTEEAKRLVLDVMLLLQTMPQHEVLSKLESLQTETDVTKILEALRKQGVSSAGAPGWLIPKRLPFEESELEVHNHVAYPQIPFIADKVLEEVISTLSPKTPVVSPNVDGNNKVIAEVLCWLPPEDDSFTSTAATKSSANSTTLCDARLLELDITFWTNVRISNESAARIISLYMKVEHPLYGHFDPDLFLSALVSRKEDFCSSLLVNSLLYGACLMYSAIDSKYQKLAVDFRQEAERLWQDEHLQQDSICRMASAQFLSQAYLGQGRDHIYLKYVQETCAIGTRMGLFGVEKSKTAEDINNMKPESARAMSYAAWGTFNFLTLCCLFYRQPGMQLPSRPPLLPIPYNSRDEGIGSQISLPCTSSHPPSFMGSTVTYLCEFCVIIHELCKVYYYSNLNSLHQEPRFTEFKFRELLAWSKKLSISMTRHRGNSHHVLILHLWFHSAILDLFRPALRSKLDSEQQLRTFSSRDMTPRAVYGASLRQLQRLILIYCTNYRSSTYTILWHSALIYVANAAIKDMDHENWFSYLMLCLCGYQRLHRSWRLADLITQALLSMTLRSGKISSERAREILAGFDRRGLGDIKSEGSHATFMADLDLAPSDPKSATVEKVASDFDEIATLMEFTTIMDIQ